MADIPSKKYLNFSHAHWLQRAAEILEEDAEALKNCHTIEGEWSADEPEVQEHYNEMREAARAVRAEYERSASASETTAVTRDTPIIREIFERHDRASKLLWGPAALPGMMLGPEDADAAHSDRGRLLSLIPGSPVKTNGDVP